MTVNIHFDTGSLTSEEGNGLSAFLGAVQPSLRTAVEMREHERNMYGSNTFGPPIGYAAEAISPPEAQAAKAETTPVEPAKRGRKPKAEMEAKSNISAAPENRVDPENPEDAAQDAADEQAEVDAGRDPGKPLTVEDLKNVMGLYVNKFTMEATKEDGVKIFANALGAPPAGEAGWKASLVAEAGQAALAKAIMAWKAAAAADKRFGA